MGDRPYTPERLAERWDCSPAHVRRLCKRGDLPHFRIGKEYRIPLQAIEEIETCDGRLSGSSSTEESGTPSGSTGEKLSDTRFVPRIVP